MKAEIKSEFVNRLNQMGDTPISRNSPFPTLNVLIQILYEQNPSVNFGDLENKQARENFNEEMKSIRNREGSDSNPTEEEINAVKSKFQRGEGWDNILHYSGLRRFYFYLNLNGTLAGIAERRQTVDGEIVVKKEKVFYKPWNGYKYPTLTSVVHDYKLAHNGKNPSGELMAELISKHYIENE